MRALPPSLLGRTPARADERVSPSLAGIQGRAIDHYRKVLSIVSTSSDAMPVDGDDDDADAAPSPTARALAKTQSGVARAAAYNMWLLYIMADRADLAREVAAKWLAA